MLHICSENSCLLFKIAKSRMVIAAGNVCAVKTEGDYLPFGCLSPLSSANHLSFNWDACLSVVQMLEQIGVQGMLAK